MNSRVPQIIQVIDHDLALKPMVTTGDHFQKPPICPKPSPYNGVHCIPWYPMIPFCYDISMIASIYPMNVPWKISPSHESKRPKNLTWFRPRKLASQVLESALPWWRVLDVTLGRGKRYSDGSSAKKHGGFMGFHGNIMGISWDYHGIYHVFGERLLKNGCNHGEFTPISWDITFKLWWYIHLWLQMDITMGSWAPIGRDTHTNMYIYTHIYIYIHIHIHIYIHIYIYVYITPIVGKAPENEVIKNMMLLGDESFFGELSNKHGNVFKNKGGDSFTLG